MDSKRRSSDELRTAPFDASGPLSRSVSENSGARSRRQISARRIAYWGQTYLNSVDQSHTAARRFFHAHDPDFFAHHPDFFSDEPDFFAAYLHLFVTFNNLYGLIAGFDGREPHKIRVALGHIPDEVIDGFYTPSYVELINAMNDARTEQFRKGPDKRARVRGIVKMRDYFQGKDAEECVAHVSQIADVADPTEQKRKTVQEVAACLLYTVRNNQFHAFKGPRRLADLVTLRAAYELLLPLVDALIPVAGQTVAGAKNQTRRRRPHSARHPKAARK